jgi:ubiquinone/menaquinone biosynthesis C-methylase UbiE
MADLVRGKAAENGWENVETDVLDVRDLKTLKDNTFTHVITNFGFAADVKDLNGPLKAAKEMYRVLKPGGVTVVTAWSGMCCNFFDGFVHTRC